MRGCSVPSRCSVVGALAWLKHALSCSEVHVGLAFGNRCARGSAAAHEGWCRQHGSRRDRQAG
jgi:hypothetical protein